jgi:hypothetical protein
MEEHQHAQLDTLMVEAIVDGMSPADVEKGIAGYVDLGAFIDVALKQQTQFDLTALETAMARMLSDDNRARFMAVQHQANRWTYIGSGMSHPKFLETMGAFSPDARRRMEAAAPSYC